MSHINELEHQTIAQMLRSAPNLLFKYQHVNITHYILQADI